MKQLIVALGAVLSASACHASVGNAANAECPKGAVVEADLSGGELLLNEDDLVKINLNDQASVKEYGEGKPFFDPNPDIVERYNLKAQEKWKWIAAPSKGFFGKNPEDANVSFKYNTEISASYFPASKKVIVSVMTPDIPGAQTFEYWVLVRVPDDFASITYDCGTFK